MVIVCCSAILAVLFWYLGVSMFAGLGVIVAFLPFTAVLGISTGKLETVELLVYECVRSSLVFRE